MEHDHTAPPIVEREQYTRGNTEGKVIRILCESLYDCPNNPIPVKASYRAKYSLPSLKDGMTVREWRDKTLESGKAAGLTGGGEGIPNIFLTELVAHKFIEFVDA